MESSKKKLLITASTFPRWEGDTEPRFILDYAQAMTKYFDVTVLAPAAVGAKKKERIGNVNIIRYHYFLIHKMETLCYPGSIMSRMKEKKIRGILVPFLFAALYIKLFEILPEYDLVHAHWLIPQGIVQSFFKTPYLVTGHGGDVTSLNIGLLKRLKKNCLRKAGAVTAVSEFLKKQIEKIEPSAKPFVISMGVNTSAFGEQYRRENYFAQGSRRVILSVGRLVEKKGHRYLIEAMKYIDALCVIVGDGALKEELIEQAGSLLNKKILFLGSKTHEELKFIYASSDIFVMPSITARDSDVEGLGLVMLEAMASGLPVVASKSGGISDVIINNINGILCEERSVWQLIESINCLLDDHELYDRIKTAAKQSVQRFDYREIAQEYYQIISERFEIL